MIRVVAKGAMIGMMQVRLIRLQSARFVPELIERNLANA
jgi:hypothetical protein